MIKQPPSRWWHLASLIVFLSCAIATPIAMIFLLIGQLSSGEEFIVPGIHFIKVDKPGKYGIWNIVSEFRNGTQRAYSEKLPDGTRIRITSSVGKEIPTTSDMNCTETSGNSSRTLICSFEIQEIGSYSIIVDGISEERSLMVRRSMVSWLILSFILVGFVSVLGWIIPILISVLVEVKRYNLKRGLANQVLNSTVDPPGSTFG